MGMQCVSRKFKEQMTFFNDGHKNLQSVFMWKLGNIKPGDINN